LETGDPRLFTAAESMLERERAKREQYLVNLSKPNVTEKHKAFLDVKISAIDVFERTVEGGKQDSMDLYEEEMQETDEGLGKSKTPSPEEESEESEVDDFADASVEPMDYTGGDD
jgi:hypothetical protein